MNYYIRARKKNCSVIYLAQNFFQVPKVIRLNCMYFVILKLSCDRDMRLILKEMSLGLTAEQLLKLYAFATDTKFVPLLVDMEESQMDKKFRKGLLEYLNPADYA